MFAGIHKHPEVKETILQIIKPLLESWSKQKLNANLSIYGIRRYLRGAWLSFHVDRMPTHVLSVIMQVLNQMIQLNVRFYFINFENTNLGNFENDFKTCQFN